MCKLKNAIDDVNNTRSMAGNKFDITDIEYREKDGRKFLDIEVQEPEKLKKAMQAKYGKSVKFNIEPDTGNAEVYFEELEEEIEENVALFKKRYMYSKKADAEKKAKEIGGKVEKSKAAHFPGYYAVKEETETKSIEQSIMDVWNSAAGEQIKREDDAKWLKTEEKKNQLNKKLNVLTVDI